MPASQNAFRVGFVPGVMPDKWGRTWAERMPRRPLDLVPLGDGDGVAMVRAGELDMGAEQPGPQQREDRAQGSGVVRRCGPLGVPEELP